MKGDLKGIDVGSDDIEEIGMDDEEDEDSQGQTNGSDSSAKWDNYSFIFFVIWKKFWIYTFSMIKIIIRHFVIYNKGLPSIDKELEIKFLLTKFSML